MSDAVCVHAITWCTDTEDDVTEIEINKRDSVSLSHTCMYQSIWKSKKTRKRNAIRLDLRFRHKWREIITLAHTHIWVQFGLRFISLNSLLLFLGRRFDCFQSRQQSICCDRKKCKWKTVPKHNSLPSPYH